MNAGQGQQADIGGHGQAARDAFAPAHRALIDDGAIQFAMGPVPPKAPPPDWMLRFMRWLGDALAPVGGFFRWLGGLLPDARYLLWGALAVLAAALAWIVVDRVRHGEWRLPRLRRRKTAAAIADEAAAWAPAAAQSREWLRQADALAADGRFAEAVHHLLFRSVEDIAERRPGAVRPALTSRELARASLLPHAVRPRFARIAALVERSLFGGAPLVADDWQAARADYADLAQPQAWHA